MTQVMLRSLRAANVARQVAVGAAGAACVETASLPADLNRRALEPDAAQEVELKRWLGALLFALLFSFYSVAAERRPPSLSHTLSSYHASLPTPSSRPPHNRPLATSSAAAGRRHLVARLLREQQLDGPRSARARPERRRVRLDRSASTTFDNLPPPSHDPSTAFGRRVCGRATTGAAPRPLDVAPPRPVRATRRDGLAAVEPGALCARAAREVF